MVIKKYVRAAILASSLLIPLSAHAEGRFEARTAIHDARTGIPIATTPFARVPDAVVRPDGRPLIFFTDVDQEFKEFTVNVTSYLSVWDCHNINCGTGTRRRLEIDSGLRVNAVMRQDDTPIVEYFDRSNGVGIYACGNSDCTEGNKHTVFSGGRDSRSDIAIRPNGLPMISFAELNGNEFRVFDCENTSCTQYDDKLIEFGTGITGSSTIAIGANGLPLIAWPGSTVDDLRIFACSDANCDAGVLTELAPDIVSPTEIVQQTNGLPLVAYTFSDIFLGSRVLAFECANASCTDGQEMTLVDSATLKDMTVGSDGLPVFAYVDSDAPAEIKLRTCTTTNCSQGVTSTIPTSGEGIFEVDIAIRPNGFPFVSYITVRNVPPPELQLTELFVYDCADVQCTFADAIFGGSFE